MIIYSESCPRCFRTNVKTIRKLHWFLLFLASGVFLFFVGILFFPIWLFSLLLIFFSPIGFLLPKKSICISCFYLWKVNKLDKNIYEQPVLRPIKSIPNKENSVITQQTQKQIETTAAMETTGPIEITKPIENTETQLPFESHQNKGIGNTQKSKDANQNIISFNVVGVSFKNDNKIDIQPLLRKLGKDIAEANFIERFSGLTNKEIIEENTSVSEFEDLEFGEYIFFEKDPQNKYDKNAIKVIVKSPNGEKYRVGYVPKNKNKELGNLLDNDSITGISAYFVGGKIKECEYDFDNDKDVVKTKSLTLGIEITLYTRK